MNLVVKRFSDAGNFEKERLILNVNAEVDIGKFVVFRSRYLGNGEVSNKVREAFWLPDLAAAAGDLVVIYTRSGSNKSRTNDDGSKTHFLYWGKANPVWVGETDCVVLMAIDDWEPTKVT
jgi:hypothetical protein